MINRIDGCVEETNGNKHLKIADTSRTNKVLKKYNQEFNGIKYHVKKISDNRSEYDKEYMKIKFNTDDDILFFTVLYFPTITVTISCVFEKDGKFYPQVYLDECLYQVYK